MGNLVQTKNNFKALTCWVGDFNAVRTKDDRKGTTFCEREARLFNNLMEDVEVKEIKLVDRYSRG